MSSKYIIGLLLLGIIGMCACNPEAKWKTDDVQIYMTLETVSAGFIECTFSTNKEAYYLIAVEEAKEDYNPLEHQKQFMMLALDSANKEYINWRNSLLKKSEFNIAPFASHALQYGFTDKFFTGLYPDTEYWVYAFVVNPNTLTPSGRLYMMNVKTTRESVVDVHFAYRVKGNWDYIYPMDSTGNIYSQFPYIATTRDSLELVAEGAVDPQFYFMTWMFGLFLYPENASVYYGVKAMNNDGIDSHLSFQNGHTYYTGIGGFDGSFKQTTIYKFKWHGEDTEYYFVDTDKANIAQDTIW
ncbi:MAG: hypothetical protein K6A36_07275 [Paludibacteraceae bacterium]|nr:hypothetical protein [Paludibacteraceae bacterium]